MTLAPRSTQRYHRDQSSPKYKINLRNISTGLMDTSKNLSRNPQEIESRNSFTKSNELSEEERKILSEKEFLFLEEAKKI